PRARTCLRGEHEREAHRLPGADALLRIDAAHHERDAEGRAIADEGLGSARRKADREPLGPGQWLARVRGAPDFSRLATCISAPPRALHSRGRRSWPWWPAPWRSPA